MMTAAKHWLRGLTARERGLVLAAAGLSALVTLVYGVILPVGAGFDAARLHRDGAALRSGTVIAAAQALVRSGGQGNRASVGANATPVEQAVAASAQSAGLVLQSNSRVPGTAASAGEATQVAIPLADAATVLRWLDRLAGAGLTPEAVTITPRPDGSVATRATIRRLPNMRPGRS
jgi:general secretion pathway protein M